MVTFFKTEVGIYKKQCLLKLSDYYFGIDFCLASQITQFDYNSMQNIFFLKPLYKTANNKINTKLEG